MHKILKAWVDGKIKTTHLLIYCPKCNGEMMSGADFDGKQYCRTSKCDYSTVIYTPEEIALYDAMSEAESLDAIAIPKGYRVRDRAGCYEVVAQHGGVVFRCDSECDYAHVPVEEWLRQKPWIKSSEVPAIAAKNINEV